MGKEPEKTFLKRRHTNGQEVHEKVLCISNHQRNTNQNHNVFIYLQWKQGRVFILVRMAINQEITNVDTNIQKGDYTLYTTEENVNWYSHFGK